MSRVFAIQILLEGHTQLREGKKLEWTKKKQKRDRTLLIGYTYVTQAIHIVYENQADMTSQS